MYMVSSSARNWYTRLVIVAEANLEEKIFQSIRDPNIDQKVFNQLLGQWMRTTAPDMIGEKLPRRKRQTPSGYHSTVFLSGQNSPTLMHLAEQRKNERGRSNLGLIAQPLTMSYLRSDVLRNFDAFALDNGMFSEEGQKNFDWDVYEKMVKIALVQEKRDLAAFNFFTVPDQPFDWARTMDKFKRYNPKVQMLRRMGAPAAIVTQEGATVDNVPFDQIDAIFIGGKDEYKESDESKRITWKARRMGMNVHMGRVNTESRLNKASQWGVDTADGTYIMFEFGKALFRLQRDNPRKPGENDDSYYARIKQLFESGDGPNTEKEIVEHFVYNVVDRQTNNPSAVRYKQIGDLTGGGNAPFDRDALNSLTHLSEPIDETSPEVVQFDQNNEVQQDEHERPVKNPDVFGPLSNGYHRGPYDPVPPLEKDYIKQMRRLGLIPR